MLTGYLYDWGFDMLEHETLRDMIGHLELNDEDQQFVDDNFAEIQMAFDDEVAWYFSDQ
jgi:hypothetical protein